MTNEQLAILLKMFHGKLSTALVECESLLPKNIKRSGNFIIATDSLHGVKFDLEDYIKQLESSVKHDD